MSKRADKRLPVLALLIVAMITAAAATGATFWSMPSGLQPTTRNVSLMDTSYAYGTRHLSFEPNVGQIGGPVRYQAHAPGADLFFTPSEVVLALGMQRKEAGAEEPARSVAGLAAPESGVAFAESSVRLQFSGSNPAPEIEHDALMPGKVNYVIGSNPSTWHTNIPLYDGITYKTLYRGIDLSYSGEGGRLKGTYLVESGADPSTIRWRYAGANSLRVDADGNLQISVSDLSPSSSAPTGRSTVAEVTEMASEAWQEVGGTQIAVSVSYDLRADGSVGFVLGRYDSARPLIIDPILTYSTYLGGNGTELPYGVAVDAARNVYVVGMTTSSAFPLQNTSQTDGTITSRLFVTKMNAQGTALLYTTYLAGSAVSWGRAIAVNSSGEAVIVGQTSSSDFPIVNAIQPVNAGGDEAYVSKLSADGSALLFSTYLGGSGNESANSVAVDPQSNIYVTGSTTSATTFPRVNAIQNVYGGGPADAFVTKYTPNGQAYIYSTFLGGAQGFAGDMGNGIAADSAGNAYITGETDSETFPVANAFQPTYQGGESDVFVTKLNPAGSAFIYSTFLGGGHALGGTGTETGVAIAADSAGSAYITGNTDSTDFPTRNPIHGSLTPSYDAFVTKMNPTGSDLVYSTYMGGNGPGNEGGNGIAVDPAGEAIVVGLTASPDFPVVNPLQSDYRGGIDAFVLKLSASGTSAIYVTYLGGTNSDYGQAAATDADGTAYATGWTASSDFPTANALQGQYAGNADAFISKITDTVSGGTPSPTPSIPSATGTSTSTSTSTSTTTPTPPAPTPTTPPTSTPPAATSTSGATATSAVTSLPATHTRTATATPAVPSPVPTNPPGASPTPCALSFSDVPVGSTFYSYIRCLACLGIVNGYADGTFRPGNNVTRGQFAKIVANAGGFHDPPVGQTFEDVPPGSTFYTYTERLASFGVMSGYPCGGPGEHCNPPGNRPYFRPNNNATRGQISKMVSNAAGFVEPAGAQQFEDVPPTHIFFPFIWRLASRGIMQGYPCGEGVLPGSEPCNPPNNRPNFRPSNNATRGQTSKIVTNTFYPNCNPPTRKR